MSRFGTTTAGIAFYAILLVNGQAQDYQRSAVSEQQESLKAFLQRYASSSSLANYKATRYLVALTQLNSTGPGEAIVYLSGDGWCGSGGCTTLILSRDGVSWKVVSRITITWPPIRVLGDSTNGWHSIAVWVRGGGIRPGYEAELAFDGKSYPANPSVAPARPTAGQVAGEIAIPSEEGTPLFQ